MTYFTIPCINHVSTGSCGNCNCKYIHDCRYDNYQYKTYEKFRFNNLKRDEIFFWPKDINNFKFYKIENYYEKCPEEYSMWMHLANNILSMECEESSKNIFTEKQRLPIFIKMGKGYSSENILGSPRSVVFNKNQYF